MGAAIAFLTIVGRGRTPDTRTFRWFPLVGAALGFVTAGIWWLAARWWTAPVAAAITVAADLALTGLLHVDGLADSADGLLPPVDRERRLQIMSSPDVGAFGVSIVGTVLLLRFAVLASLEPDGFLLAAIWCLSRSGMAVLATTMRYARQAGLASAFAGAHAGPIALTGAVLSIGLALGSGAAVAAAVGAGAVAMAAVGCLAHRRLGGFTGDVLGAAGIVGETVALLVAAAS